MSHGSRFRELIERDSILVCPGVHDALSARIMDEMGFEAVSLTGYGTAASLLGYPDVQLVTLDEMVTHARNVQSAVSIPVLGDAESGWGNAITTVRSIREFCKADVGGIHIEDSEFPFMYQDDLASEADVQDRDTAVENIRAAADTRDEHDEDFVVMSKVDVLKARGGTLDEAIERANAYYDVGADINFVSGVTARDDAQRVADEVAGPLAISAHDLDFDYDGPEELEEMGYALADYPQLSLFSALKGMVAHTRQFKDDAPGGYGELLAAFDETVPGGVTEYVRYEEVLEDVTEYIRE